MADKNADRISVVPGLKVDYQGIFDLSDLYKKTKAWMNYEGYGDENSNFLETKYIERIRPIGKQIEIKWFGEKIINDYISYFITVEYTGIGIKDTEVTFEGRKIKMNSGHTIITIKADLILNRQGKWEKDSILKRLHDRRLFRKYIEDYRDDLMDKATSLFTEIKAYFNLHQF